MKLRETYILVLRWSTQAVKGKVLASAMINVEQIVKSENDKRKGNRSETKRG